MKRDPHLLLPFSTIIPTFPYLSFNKCYLCYVFIVPESFVLLLLIKPYSFSLAACSFSLHYRQSFGCTNQVTKIREQCQKQEATLKEQEGELDSRRSELQKLRDEEQSLEKEYNTSTKEVDRLTSQLQDTQLEISQVKAMVTQIQEYQRQMTDALSMFRSAIESNDPILVSDYSLKIEPEFREAKQALEEKEVENANKRDPFGDNRSNGFGAGEPAETGFGDDFKSSNGFATQFDVGSNGGFHGGTAAAGGFGEDGFGAFGAKAPSHAIGGGAADPFGSGAAADPFGDRKGSGSVAAEVRQL